ncbi:MAG: hypothetical protein E7310_03240 [Clostridiales bacterium]|nr:hypothetical protein [Clostridiales bacterium]
MKKTSRLLILGIFILGIILSSFFSITYATETKKINAKGLRDTYSYAFLDENNVFQRILKLYEVNNENVDFLIYCARGGLGFGGNGKIEPLDYNLIADFKTQKTEVVNKYKEFMNVNLDRNENISIEYIFNKNQFNDKSDNEEERFNNLRDFLNKNADKVTYTTNNDNKLEFKDNTPFLIITVTYKNVNIYNAILGLIDNMYLPKNTQVTPIRKEWLNSAGIKEGTITDEQIDATQQMALWYFTNLGAEKELEKLFSFTTNGSAMSVKMKYSKIELLEKEALELSDFEDNVPESVGILYTHLLTNAIQDSYKYKTDGTTIEATPKIEFAETSAKLEIKEFKPSGTSYYLVGPFKIENKGSNKYNNFNYILTGIDSKGKETVICLDDSGMEQIIVTDSNGIKNLGDINSRINQGEFYIRILKSMAIAPTEKVYDISNFRMEFSYDYYKSSASLWTTESKEDQPVIIVNKVKETDNADKSTSKIEGNFNVEIVKIDAATEKKLPGATFTIEDESRQIVALKNNQDGTFETGNVKIESKDDKFIYTITETKAPVGYNGISSPVTIEITVKEKDGEYVIDKAIMKEDVQGVALEVNEVGTTIKLTVTNKEKQEFDLALRKYITKLERDNKNIEITNKRELNNIDTSTISTKGTATYNHRKDPVEVETGDIVTYTFRVYNEAAITGYVTSITDYLPQGVEFVATEEFISKNDWKAFYDIKENEEKTLTEKYIYEFNETERTLTITPMYNPNLYTTMELKPCPNEYLFKLDAFDSTHQDAENWVNGLNYGELNVKFKVTATSGDNAQILTNIATMTYESEGIEKVADRDSKGETFNKVTNLNTTDVGYTGKDNYTLVQLEENKHFEGQEDDDDFEKIIIRGVDFDLALRKFITKVNGKELKESRVPSIDLTTLEKGQVNEKGQREYTATYTHPKTTVTVHKGDIVTYKLRVYNEGEVDGYATKVADYLPEGLGLLLQHNTTIDNQWKVVTSSKMISLVGEDGFYKNENDVLNLKLEDFTGVKSLKDVQIVAGKAKIESNLIQDDKILAYDKNAKADEGWQKAATGEGGLYYEEIEVACIVLAENTFKGSLVNIAEISEDKAVDENGNEINANDRDSKPGNVDLDNYEIKKENSTYQQDDDDYEPLSLEYFDLALRKFITKVNGEAPKVSRVPQVDVTPLVDGTATTAKYNHPKDPLYVTNGDEVEYTIRIYNEGSTTGYAYEIADDIPEGLVFDPKNETNIKYGWKMYKEAEEKATKYDYIYNNKKYVETEKAEEATIIRTRYLDTYILKAFDPDNKAIDYADVKVVFTIDEKYTDATRLIKNEAQITEDSGDDIDSTPNDWKGEDDEDIEYVYVQYFDLSLLKWVTKSIVTVDGKTVTTETGFEPNTGLTETTGIRDNAAAEPVAKVEVDRKKLKNTEVKFVYKIRVTNEGEIAGYATEVTDYVPVGLEFFESDNTAYGWKIAEKGKVTTRALETVLLQPGESAELEIVFRWINDANNLGIKTNVAEISEDYSINSDKSPDIDSDPEYIDIENYIKEQEDDDDFALVILSIKTGGGAAMAYMGLITTVVAILAVGIFLIKKYVII